MEMLPVPSARRNNAFRRKSKKSKKAAAKRKRNNRTIAEVVVMVLRHADRALSPRTISKVLTAMDINVNKFILKKTLKRMTKRKLIRTKKRSFVLTKKGKKVRRSKIHKKSSKHSRAADRKFRNRMRRHAHKQARGGRTMEQCVNDALKRYTKKRKNYESVVVVLE